jgi:hypothetical protein
MGQGPLRIVFNLLFAVASAACAAGAPSALPTRTGTTPNLTPSSELIPTSSATPSPTVPREKATATLTWDPSLGDADGPGISVSDAIANAGGAEPLLVNGILLREVDGTVWLCQAMQTLSPPRCSEPSLLVVYRPPDDQVFVDGPGLHVADGIRWVEQVQRFGMVRR